MKEKLIKLIDVKTLITLSFLVMIAWGFFGGLIGNGFIEQIGMMVISFYFGTQVSKKTE